MNEIFYPTLAVVAWVAAAVRLTSAIRLGAATPSRNAVTAACVLLATTFTASTPAVWGFADRITGVDNITALIAHLCVVSFSVTIQVLLLGWTHPVEVARRRSRRRLVALFAVAVVLGVLFTQLGPMESRTTDFVASYAHRPQLAAYLIVYVSAFAAGLIDIIRICWPHARLLGSGWLRRGLRTTAVGASIGLVYCVARLLDASSTLGWDPPRWEGIIPISSSSGALLVVVGLTMPVWGPRVARVGGMFRAVRRHQQLRPLWSELTDAVPGVRLPAGPGRWRPGDRLHRRVIEIYDARLALRPYIGEHVSDEARRQAQDTGLTGDDLTAAVEAARIRAGLSAMATGVPPTHVERPAPPDPTQDEEAEIRQLIRVARAFTRSRPVAVPTAESVHDR